jgi:hypothetical protein
MSFEHKWRDCTLADFAVRSAMLASLAACVLPLTGCPYYVPAQPTVVMTPASFDRSFSAAAGAMSDEGLALTVQDPGTGTIAGTSPAGSVTATVRQQSDGSVVVQFNSPDARDPTLLQRVTRSYDRRMGR